MSDEKKLQDEELDKVSGGVGGIHERGIHELDEKGPGLPTEPTGGGRPEPRPSEPRITPL
jgi:hypothetical protein